MYALLAILGLCKLPKWGFAFVAAVFMALNIFWALTTPDQVVFYRTDLRQVTFCGIYFFMGVLMHKFNVQRWFSLSNVLLALILWLIFSANRDHFNVAAWFFLPFLVMAFGLSQQPLLTRLTPHDYSYGIYIYAFPVQQTVAFYWPNMPLIPYLLCVSAITLALAAASWHWVESPALRLKPQK
jgi:peptidoglycan/LPS O-acetylase OafA/YrhL